MAYNRVKSEFKAYFRSSAFEHLTAKILNREYLPVTLTWDYQN